MELANFVKALQIFGFHALLSVGNALTEAVQTKKECLNIKLMAEREVVLFRQQLLALRQALARAQADNVKMCRQQENQAQLLKELEHRVTQEALHRQQLDLMKASSMEKLLKDVEQKEQHLQLLTEDAKRASKLGQLQQKKIQRELRQVTPVRGSKSGRTSQSGFHLVLSTPLLPPQWYSLPRSLPGTAGKWKYLLYLGDCSSCL